MTQDEADPAEVRCMPMTALTLRRWTRTPSPAAASSSLRTEVRPPSLRHAPDSMWQRALCWIMAPSPLDTAPSPRRLPEVRAEFQAAVADLTAAAEAGALVRRIEISPTLRDLWHLRAEVYRLVALQHSQAEAEVRLARLNRHFPTRSPRSGFAPL